MYSDMEKRKWLFKFIPPGKISAVRDIFYSDRSTINQQKERYLWVDQSRQDVGIVITASEG